jgi:small subunit ribosomal protein S1
MKQLEDNPWNGYDKKYTMGTIVKGKVTDFADYGAFVQLDNEDIEGLVYYSEISWSKNNQNPKKLLTLGQEVTCKVLELDVEKHRISLINNPWIEFSEKHPVGSIISGEVRNVADFGMFIAIGGDIDGMVRDTDIAQGISGAEALKLHKKGDIVTCKVLSIDVEKEKVSLGIRQAGDAGDPDASLGIYKKGQICTCTASSIEPEGVFVELEDGQKGFIKKAELSSEKSEQKVEKFNIGDRFDAYITSVSKQKNLVNLSIKVLEAEERNRAIKEYGSTDSGASLGDILGAALKKSN